MPKPPPASLSERMSHLVLEGPQLEPSEQQNSDSASIKERTARKLSRRKEPAETAALSPYRAKPSKR